MFHCAGKVLQGVEKGSVKIENHRPVASGDNPADLSRYLLRAQAVGIQNEIGA